MQITQDELKALTSLLGKLDTAGLMGDLGFAKKDTEQKQLADFSKTFVSVIEEKFKRIKHAQFSIGGVSFVSIHSITCAFGWAATADFVQLAKSAEASFVCARTVGHLLEHDGGTTMIPKKSTYETLFVRLGDVEELTLTARPRKGKTALAKFRKDNGLPV